ncbi:ABC transporter ATP-binding protein [Palleronia sp. KMU-117]|uniref:ABC transporter ATP-binding protein n=1 Tax=Palleronia sp. KMU-117 TaxID=3434108 RepID=UPI003D70BD85
MTLAVEFEHVSRHFGQVRAVDDVSIGIEEGCFFAMLGPSGSGKTTCLRLISGFERPTAGHVRIFGQNSEAIPPNRRPVNTVFQDYALFPHLTVRENVAYGPKMAGVDRRTRDAAAEEMLSLVKLSGYGDRKPGQLSGGQRQRVALARALVNRPRVLLLDEPLGALDLKLREAMQEELKTLQQTLGITFIFVTHDQGEALSMADRVAVFNDGRIVQEGTPQEIYDRPRTRFVADFVGSANVLSPEISARAGGPASWASLRAEAITLTDPATARLSGTVRSVRYLGAVNRVTVAIPEGELTANVPTGQPLPSAGATVGLFWDGDALHRMDGDA